MRKDHLVCLVVAVAVVELQIPLHLHLLNPWLHSGGLAVVACHRWWVD